MAFSRSGLCRIGGSGTGGSTWQYATADTTAAVVADTNYFASAASELERGDLVIVIGTISGTVTARISYIESNDGTTVVMAAGNVVAA